MFDKKVNTLVKPVLWDDPFENFILKSPGIMPNGENVRFGFHDHLYGQCWSLKVESDAIWRIFAPDKDGVKIRTTVNKLYYSLYEQANPANKDISCFIGKVKYLAKKKLIEYVDNFNPIDSRGDRIASSLLIKRTPFSHENEVRLIYMQHDRNLPDSNIFQYPFDVLKTVDQITFDPRMDYDKYVEYKNEFKSLGFEGNIIQSSLYTPPKGFLIKI
jgi:hypothetical protein